MKKALVLVLMLTLVASAMAATYPIDYKDKYCKGEWVKHGYHWKWEEKCITKDRETSVDIPKTDLTPVEDRITALEYGDGKGFGYSKFMKAMETTVLDWLKTVFVQIQDYNKDKVEQEQIDREQNKRIFECEKALGMTEGY